MDIKELRVGNKLYNEGVVVTIDARTLFDIWDNKNLNEKYKAIPIKEEHLLNSGFEKVQKGYFVYYVLKYLNKYKTTEHSIELSLEPMGDNESGHYNIAIWIGSDSIVHIYSLHKLQNLCYELMDQDLKFNNE